MIDTSGYKEATDKDLKAFLKVPAVATDYETNGKNVFSKDVKVLSQSFCSTEGKSVVVVFDSDKDKEKVRAINENEKVAKVLASRPFDETVARNLVGAEMKGPVYDIFTMMHCLDENLGGREYGLEALSNRLTPLKNIKDLSQGKRFDLGTADRKTLVEYNAVDSDATLRIFNILRGKLAQDKKVARYYLKFMCPIQDMFADIYSNGMVLNTKKLKENEEKATLLLADLQSKAFAKLPKRLIEKYGKKMKLSTTSMVQEYLFSSEYLGLKPKMFTDTTKLPSTSEDHMKMFSHIPFVKHRLEWVTINKILTSYLANMWEHVNDDGRVYPSTFFTTAVTGRSSMGSPSIQNIPQHSSYAYLVRELFEADKGWLLGARDLGQSELRIAGFIAQDRAILKALDDGIDLHTMTAAVVNKIPIEQVTKEQRQKAKSVNFGFIFGMSAVGNGEGGFKAYAKKDYGIDFTTEECHKIRANFFEGYKELPIWHSSVKDFCFRNGYVESLLGRKRRLPDIRSKDYAKKSSAQRQAVNSPVQGFSSDLAYLGKYLFWKEYKSNTALAYKVKTHWLIHDATIFQAKEKVMNKAMEVLKDCMENRTKEYIRKNFKVDLTYPITSDGAVGRTWEDLKSKG